MLLIIYIYICVCVCVYICHLIMYILLSHPYTVSYNLITNNLYIYIHICVCVYST